MVQQVIREMVIGALVRGAALPKIRAADPELAVLQMRQMVLLRVRKSTVAESTLPLEVLATRVQIVWRAF